MRFEVIVDGIAVGRTEPESGDPPTHALSMTDLT